MSDELTIIRAVVEPAVVEDGDGRTIEARIVPYNTVARVADPPDFAPYDELFVPGAFRGQLNAANRVNVLMNFLHGRGIGDVVGRGTALDDRGDALYGTFRALDHSDGDKALELIRSGDLTGMSGEFVARRSRVVNGVTHRLDARLVNVALCPAADSGNGGPIAAYRGAEVLAVRSSGLRVIDAAPPMRHDLRERLTALGFEPLLARAVVRRPWDGSPARFTDEQYQRSCLIDRGGDAPVKERCSLPVLEPNGDLNTNALGPAAAALAGARGGLANVTPAMKAAAARKLVRYYRMAEMTPPASMTAMMAA